MHVSVETGYCWYSRFIHSFAHTAQDGSACLRWDSTLCWYATALFRRGVGRRWGLGGGQATQGPRLQYTIRVLFMYMNNMHQRCMKKSL